MKDFAAFCRDTSKHLITSPILHGLIMGNASGMLFHEGHNIVGCAVFTSFAVMSWFMVRGKTAMDAIDKIRELRRQ